MSTPFPLWIYTYPYTHTHIYINITVEIVSPAVSRRYHQDAKPFSVSVYLSVNGNHGTYSDTSEGLAFLTQVS